jgi:hypothetical protein
MTVVAEADHRAMIVVNVAVVIRPYLKKYVRRIKYERSTSHHTLRTWSYNVYSEEEWQFAIVGAKCTLVAISFRKERGDDQYSSLSPTLFSEVNDPLTVT